MAESIDQRMSYGKVTLGHICMVIELDSPLPGGTVQAVQQASVHTNEGGMEKLLALTACPMAESIDDSCPVHPWDLYEAWSQGVLYQ